MPDPIIAERFILPSKLDVYRDGSLERRAEIANRVIESSLELFGEGSSLVATHDDHIHVLVSDGSVLRVECVWDGDDLRLGGISEAGTIFADRKEVSLFVAQQMNAVSRLLITGHADGAGQMLRDCAEFLEKGAGSWLIEDIERELCDWSGRPWRIFVEKMGRDSVISEAIRSGNRLSEFSMPSLSPRKELIQESFALMIAKIERLVEASGERLIQSKNGVSPEIAEVLKTLAQDAAFLGERLEEALDCVRYTQEASLRRFYETASNELNEMVLAFSAVPIGRKK